MPDLINKLPHVENKLILTIIKAANMGRSGFVTHETLVTECVYPNPSGFTDTSNSQKRTPYGTR